MEFTLYLLCLIEFMPSPWSITYLEPMLTDFLVCLGPELFGDAPFPSGEWSRGWDILYFEIINNPDQRAYFEYIIS